MAKIRVLRGQVTRLSHAPGTGQYRVLILLDGTDKAPEVAVTAATYLALNVRSPVQVIFDQGGSIIRMLDERDRPLALVSLPAARAS